MNYLHRARNVLFLLLMMNLPLLDKFVCSLLFEDIYGNPLTNPDALFWNSALRYAIIAVVILLYVIMGILPIYEKGLPFRLQVLSGGYELVYSSVYAVILEVIGYIAMICSTTPSDLIQAGLYDRVLLNLICAYFVLLIHYLNGFWRLCFCSSQLGLPHRIIMLFCWWIFPVNLFLMLRWCVLVRRELYYERNQYLLNAARIENEICKTRYPVLMVHGIFFRDWQFLNYWGRIPRALKKNGAHIFYGDQQSSRSVADSAEEIKEEILAILKETGAEKVNIVAHSKGGLDSRYAISKLGLEDYVSSLTTINTPHRGCHFVDWILDNCSPKFIASVANRYNKIFRKLGDEAPDFLAGVEDLRASACVTFNESVPDSPKVYYQSSMSKMKYPWSAGFPLNISWFLCRKYDGENDGLVCIDSAKWGHFLGLRTAGWRGISHADMIDLTHKNIKKFDVAEFYVQLLANLKEKGY